MDTVGGGLCLFGVLYVSAVVYGVSGIGGECENGKRLESWTRVMWERLSGFE